MMSQDHQRHLIWVYPSDFRQILDAATWLSVTKHLRNMGYRVTLIGAGQSGPTTVDGVTYQGIERTNLYFVRQLLFHLKAIMLILRVGGDADFILFHGLSSLFMLPLVLLRWLRGRQRPLFVLDVRSMVMPPEDKKTLSVRLREFYFHTISEWLGNHIFDGRTVITPRLGSVVLRIPPDKLWGVWPSGVDPDFFLPAAQSRVPHQPGQPIQLIYIGSQHYERNLMALSRAVVQANQDGMAFRLTLVGDGAQHKELEAYAVTTDGQVRVIGQVPHNQVVQFLTEAHVGCLPFPDEEKFRVSSPIKFFEYMAAGMPLLATRMIGHTDVVADGDFAFWIDGSEEADILAALRDLWVRSNELPAMGQKALAASQNWTWEASAARLKAALEHGLARHSPATESLESEIVGTETS
mgnify:CR=1 FL=1